MDIDLAGKTSNELEHIRPLVGEVCKLAIEPDGIEFEADSIEIQRIKEYAEYEGVRVRFSASNAGLTKGEVQGNIALHSVPGTTDRIV